MRFKGIMAALAVGASLVTAAPASAVSYKYCYSSLRGGGSLAPDPDVFRVGANLGAQAIYHDRWINESGSYTVYEVVRFYTGSGIIYRRFYCSGSGSYYSDGAV